MQLTLDSNFFRENLLKKTKSKGEKMIKNLDGTHMTKCFWNVEKTSFCDECCGTELFTGCCWSLSFSGESAAEYAAFSGF